MPFRKTLPRDLFELVGSEMGTLQLRAAPGSAPRERQYTEDRRPACEAVCHRRWRWTGSGWDLLSSYQSVHDRRAVDGCTVVDSPVVACGPTGLVYGYGGPSRWLRWTNESPGDAVIRLGCVWDQASAHRATAKSGSGGSDRGHGEMNDAASYSD